MARPVHLLPGASFWNHGVTRAVDEFVKQNPVEVVALRNHQFVLRKR